MLHLSNFTDLNMDSELVDEGDDVEEAGAMKLIVVNWLQWIHPGSKNNFFEIAHSRFSNHLNVQFQE